MKYKDQLNEITMEKQKLAFEVENSFSSKGTAREHLAKLDEERRQHELEVTQWKEALLELATLTLKADVLRNSP